MIPQLSLQTPMSCLLPSSATTTSSRATKMSLRAFSTSSTSLLSREAAAKLNVPRYILSPISAFSLLLVLYSPVSDAEEERTLSWSNMFTDDISSRFFYVQYGFIEYTRRSWSLSSTETMLVNLFYDMESHAFDALRSLVSYETYSICRDLYKFIDIISSLYPR